MPSDPPPAATSAAAQPIDAEALRARFSDLGVEVVRESQGDWVLEVAAEQSLAALTRLHADASLAMHRLVDLTAVDRCARGGFEGARFEVVYRLHSVNLRQRVRVHVALDPQAAWIDSVVALWPAAEWLEREVFDLFGIRFRGHPDLRRILLEADYEGAPLRKDHPLRVDRALPGEDAL